MISCLSKKEDGSGQGGARFRNALTGLLTGEGKDSKHLQHEKKCYQRRIRLTITPRENTVKCVLPYGKKKTT